MNGLVATRLASYSTNSIIVSEFRGKVTWAVGFYALAFTGSDASRGGKLEAADKGTVFLDEIGDMSAYGQAKIRAHGRQQGSPAAGQQSRNSN
jgi:sigma54-dependent transcription regulator